MDHQAVPAIACNEHSYHQCRAHPAGLLQRCIRGSSSRWPSMSAVNAAVRLLSNSSSCCHVRPLLREHHWLPIKQHVQYKLCMLVHCAILSEQTCHLTTIASSRAVWGWHSSCPIAVPRTYSSLGDHTLADAMPRAYNNLPSHIKTYFLHRHVREREILSLYMCILTVMFSLVVLCLCIYFLFGTLTVCLIYSILILTWLTEWLIHLQSLGLFCCLHLGFFVYLHVCTSACIFVCCFSVLPMDTMSDTNGWINKWITIFTARPHCSQCRALY